MLTIFYFIQNIDYEQRRFQWNKEMFFETEFQMLLKKTELTTFDSADKLILRNILSAFSATRSSHGRRGGAYGFGHSGFKGSKYKKSNYSHHSYGSHYNSHQGKFKIVLNFKIHIKLMLVDLSINIDNGSSYKENNNKSSLPTTNKDHWTILGIEKTATEADIKKAYKKLEIEKHPGNCQVKVKYYNKLERIEME